MNALTEIRNAVFGLKPDTSVVVLRYDASSPQDHRDVFKRWSAFCLFSIAALALAPALAMASSTGSGLPWETPLTTLTTSINGPVSFAVALLGLVGVGANLMWGGEMNEFLRKAIYAVCAIAFLTGSTTILSKVFNVGAVIVVAQSHAGSGVLLARSMASPVLVGLA